MEMSKDSGWFILIGLLTPVLIAWINGKVANRNTDRSAEIQEKAEENKAQQAAHEAAGGTWEQQFQFQKYIDERVEDAVKKSNEERDKRISALEAALRGSLAELVLIKNWARDYIRSVLSTWGLDPKPPRVDKHIIDLLVENDLNGTLSPQHIRQLQDDSKENQS